MDPKTTEIVVVSVLGATIGLVSTIGNGSFLAIFARFKNLRTFPNIFFANLSVIDFLSALINIPLITLNLVVQPSWMKGKTWTIVSGSLHLEFTLLNIASMSALMLDRFLALYLDLKYFSWKTTKKAYVAVFLMWLVCTVLVAASTIRLFDLDLEDSTFRESRRKIFDDRKSLVVSTMVIFTAAATILGILTSYTIYQKKKKRELLNLPALQSEARLSQDIQATKTVAMAVVTFFICYVPAITYAVLRGERDGASSSWFAILAISCTFLSSASNPIIYVFRNRRYRAAIRQLARDPCGRSPFRERPVGTVEKG